MSSPLVSLLVRSTDRATLRSTLESIGRQDYPAIEVWVVAAVPGHSPLANDLDLPHAQLVPTEVQLHRSVAANKALSLARGEYALFVDDDDWIGPSHVSALVKALQASPEQLVAYTRTRTVSSDSRADMPVLGERFDALRLLAGNSIALNSALFSTKLIALGCRFDEQLDLFEDWDFWIQALQHSPSFVFVPQASAFYRIHASSGVHEQVRFHSDAYRKVYEKWRTLWPSQALSGLMERSWLHEDLVHVVQAKDSELLEVKSELAQIHQALGQLGRQLEEERLLHEQERARIFASRSWRVTAPLRAAGRFARLYRSRLRRLWGVARKVAGSMDRLPALLRQHGVRGLLARLRDETRREEPYAAWIDENEPAPHEYPILQARLGTWQVQPLVSVLMPTYNSPLGYLQEAIESVQAQIYPHWELCIADDASPDPQVRVFLEQAAARDPRIVLSLRERNGHISASSNTALESARGEWVALLDHDDRLHPLALYRVVEALQQAPDATLVYSDEDKINERGERFDPYFKSDYNRELMWAQNMISHLGCYRRQTLLDIGGFRQGFEGSQDYDLALRVIERSRPDQIVHVPRVLYHWRAITGSTALSADQKPYAEIASRKALQEHLDRSGIVATVSAAPEIPAMNRVRLKLPMPLPLVSILIPTRDRIDLLRMCIDSLQRRSTYPHIEIIVIDNGSVEEQSLSYFDSLRANGVKVIRDDSPFNYSALNNRAAREAKGEFICLMNNDIEIITPDWLEEMLSFAALPGVGAVGTRLWYPGDAGLQHGGVVIGLGGVAGHAHSRLARHHPGYFGRIALHHRLMAVTAACLLIRKSHFMVVDGLDEGLAVAFNDVDFCLRLHRAGLACIYTPYAEMVHHESASRGDDLTGERRERFLSEVKFMQERWKDTLQDDPFFSPNLSLWHGDFRPARPSRLPKL